MRIAIVAPGAVGGYFGVLLARSGESVGAIARGAHLDARGCCTCALGRPRKEADAIGIGCYMAGTSP